MAGNKTLYLKAPTWEGPTGRRVWGVPTRVRMCNFRI